MVAELDYECVDKDEEACRDCRDRFKCWTSRSLTLPIIHLTLNKDITNKDEVSFTAELPRCFRCGNMCGSDVTIRTEVDGVVELFKGIIVAHYIRAEGTSPMTIEVKGIRASYF